MSDFFLFSDFGIDQRSLYCYDDYAKQASLFFACLDNLISEKARPLLLTYRSGFFFCGLSPTPINESENDVYNGLADMYVCVHSVYVAYQTATNKKTEKKELK